MRPRFTHLASAELASPVLEEEFNWTNTDYENITVAFQFVHPVAMLLVGHLIDKLGTKWGFALSIPVMVCGHSVLTFIKVFGISILDVRLVSPSAQYLYLPAWSIMKILVSQLKLVELYK